MLEQTNIEAVLQQNAGHCQRCPCRGNGVGGRRSPAEPGLVWHRESTRVLLPLPLLPLPLLQSRLLLCKSMARPFQRGGGTSATIIATAADSHLLYCSSQIGFYRQFACCPGSWGESMCRDRTPTLHCPASALCIIWHRPRNGFLHLMLFKCFSFCDALGLGKINV